VNGRKGLTACGKRNLNTAVYVKDCTLELGGCEYYHQTTAGSGLSTDQEISKLPVEVLHSVLERRIQSDRQRKASGKSNLRH